MGFNSASLPDSFRKCIAKEERERTPEFATSDELADKQAARAEKEMHEQFSNWCRLNNLPFIHSRMDRKPTIREGWPDFTILKGANQTDAPFRRAKVCAVEFKVSGKNLRPEQVEVIDDLLAKGVPTLIAYDVSMAIKWTKEQLEK